MFLKLGVMLQAEVRKEIVDWFSILISYCRHYKQYGKIKKVWPRIEYGDHPNKRPGL